LLCGAGGNQTRGGIGNVGAIERAAREQGAAHLDVDSSVTAEPFYAALGYEARERSEHILANGQGMARVMMRKRLRSRRQAI
jgi:putative acetyltransferase